MQDFKWNYFYFTAKKGHSLGYTHLDILMYCISSCSFTSTLIREAFLSSPKEVAGHQFKKPQVPVVQISRSVVSDSLRPHESQHARPPCPSPTPGAHPEVMSIESVIPSSHLILWHPLLLLPPIPPSIRVFSNESNESFP